MTPLSDAAGQLEAWWVGKAQEEIERTVPKAVEYGAHDLVEIGRTLAQASGREGLQESQLAELGVYFYLVGKLARWTDAVREGRQVSDDTLFDIGVYVRMAQRIRDAGAWPGVTQGSACGDRFGEHYVCTRPTGHDGIHTAEPGGMAWGTVKVNGECGDRYGAATCQRDAGHEGPHQMGNGLLGEALRWNSRETAQ